MNSSPADNVARMQFDYIKKKAEAGESFVIVGRCSEIVLKDNPHLISIFVLGDREAKIERVMRIYELDARSCGRAHDREGPSQKVLPQ